MVLKSLWLSVMRNLWNLSVRDPGKQRKWRVHEGSEATEVSVAAAELSYRLFWKPKSKRLCGITASNCC